MGYSEQFTIRNRTDLNGYFQTEKGYVVRLCGNVEVSAMITLLLIGLSEFDRVINAHS